MIFNDYWKLEEKFLDIQDPVKEKVFDLGQKQNTGLFEFVWRSI